MNKRRAISLSVALSILCILSLSPENVKASTASYQPFEMPLTPLYDGSSPDAETAFNEKPISSVGISSDGKTTAFVERDSNLLSLRTVDENRPVFTQIGADSSCFDHPGAPSPRIKDISVSANGDTVVFSSRSNYFACKSGISYGDEDSGTWRVYALHRHGSGWATELVSQSSEGREASATNPSVSADGNRVMFVSDSAVLWPGDYNENSDVFVRDLKESTTTLVSLGAGGWQADATVSKAFISANGRYGVWSASYTPGDSQVYPEDNGAVSNVMAVDMDPDNNGIIDANRINVKSLGSVNPSGTASARTATLGGVAELAGEPSVIMMQGSGATSKVYLYGLNSSRLMLTNITLGNVFSVNPDGRSATNGFNSYAFLGEQIGVSTLTQTLGTIHVSGATTAFDRVISISYENSFEAPINNATGSYPSLQGVYSHPWVSAPAEALKPIEPPSASIEEQVIWLAALSKNLDSTIKSLRYQRGDEGFKKPDTPLNESQVDPSLRSNIGDIDYLTKTHERVNSILAKANAAKERADLVQNNVLCLNKGGQWCGVARAAAGNEISTYIVDLIMNKLVKKFPPVGIFDLVWNLNNGSCASPVQQVVDFVGFESAKGVISFTRSQGEAASWPVSANILADVYEIDKPWCFNQIGIDPNALLQVVGDIAPSMPPKWEGLTKSILAVEESVSQLEALLG